VATAHTTHQTDPMTETESIAYDVVVLGAGPVGENVADRTRAAGLSTAVVESELVGGECSYWACMPSKALLRSSSALQAARRLPGAREAVTGTLDVAAVLARRDEFTSHWKDDGQVAWLDSAGIDLVRGHGRLAGVRVVEVSHDAGTTTLTARHAVVIATGTAALLPEIPGLREAEPWTSREATSVKTIPARLAILGGGVVGTEMATAYASLGSTVTLLARDGLLAHSEPFAGELVTDALREAGVDVRLSAKVESVERAGAVVRISLADGETVEADELLVAVGRSPRTGEIGLETAGLKPGDWLEVDDTLRVSAVPDGWLYAAGDVNHRALLTHQGKYQARAVGDVIAARAADKPVHDEPWGAHVATADHRAVPQVVFTDPEVASVGLTAEAAEQAGYRVRAVDYEVGSVAGASLHADGYKGHARMVVDEDRQVLLGFTIVGPDVAELLQAATIAIVGEVPLSRLWHAVPAYPTISEIWLRLLETYGRPE
jgi:pyruvate/2-oxoglutarate dehydrogenase complex dihydrolipoamide dehydrogenase (E3) component